MHRFDQFTFSSYFYLLLNRKWMEALAVKYTVNKRSFVVVEESDVSHCTELMVRNGLSYWNVMYQNGDQGGDPAYFGKTKSGSIYSGEHFQRWTKIRNGQTLGKTKFSELVDFRFWPFPILSIPESVFRNMSIRILVFQNKYRSPQSASRNWFLFSHFISIQFDLDFIQFTL